MKKIIIFLYVIVLMFGAFQITYANLDDSLVAYYPFNGDATDQSGNGNNGIINGAILTEDRDGNVDSAYSFDGVDDYIKVSTDNFKNQPFSVVAWMKTNSKEKGTILNYRNKDAYYGWGLYFNGIDTQKCLHFGLGSSSSGGSVKATSCKDIYDDEWHFIAGTDDGETLKLYIDGILFASSNSKEAVWAATMYSYIGASRPESHLPKTYWFNGSIDDIRIYNCALTQCQIQQLLKWPICISPPNKDFGIVATGCTSPHSFTLKNLRNSTLELDTLFRLGANASEFKIQNDNCSGETLDPNETCTFDVVFAPISLGSKTAKVNIPFTDPNVDLQELPLSGMVTEVCEGDFEPDNDVDGSDLSIFAADFGRTDCCNPDVAPCDGDFDEDCDVDGSDLAVFAADFGRTDCPSCPSTE